MDIARHALLTAVLATTACFYAPHGSEPATSGGSDSTSSSTDGAATLLTSALPTTASTASTASTALDPTTDTGDDPTTAVTGTSATLDLTTGASAICGDGVVETGEACDDGNTLPGDTCGATCTPTNIIDIGIGSYFTCIAFATGEVRCWGRGDSGSLGQGSPEDRGDQPNELPVPDIELGGHTTMLGTGGGHTCVRLDNGRARCWGYGFDGALGYGTTTSLGGLPGDLPTPDVDIDADVQQIAGGGGHTCVIVTGGKVRCWGFGNSGQLGYGTSESTYSPPEMDVPGIDGADQLALGYAHTCVLQAGQVLCWGRNDSGQLGLGNIDDVGDDPGELPAAIDLDGLALQIAAGFDHTCALLDGGKVRCWGNNNAGKLGNGAPGEPVGDDPGDLPPVDVNLDDVPAAQVVAGIDHTCARLTTGAVKCWGKGDDGALGYGATLSIQLPDDFPPPDVDLGGDAALLGAHLGQFNCALLTDGTLRCWGQNVRGQLGHGHTNTIGDDFNETPAAAGPVPF